MQMMRSTSTVILPLRDAKTDRNNDLLDTLMEEEGEENTCELAVLGEPLARAVAELRIRALVEKHNPGYAEKDLSSKTHFPSASRSIASLHSSS